MVTRDQVKAQCEIDSDITVHDALIDEICEEVTDFLEQELHSTLMETRYILRLNDWGCSFPARVQLPMGPIIDVHNMTYTDKDGAVQVNPVDDYTLIKDKMAGEIVPAYGKWWPFNRAHPGSIAIEYTAGYVGPGSPPTSGVPASLRRAAKLLAAHWFENREAFVTGTIVTELPMGVERAIHPYRNYFP